MSYGDYKLYLYENSVDLVINDTGLYVDNRPMNNKRLIAHKGLTNEVFFTIRNKDRKPQNIFTDTLVAYLINPVTKRRLFKKTLEAQSEIGLAKLTLTEADLQNVSGGLYTMYVARTTGEGVDTPTYADQNNNLRFDIQVTEQIDQTPVPTQEANTFLQVATAPPDAANVFASSALFGNQDRNFTYALHSMGLYTTSYTGNITIQGSCIESTPSNDNDSNDWFDITTVALSNVSVVTPVNFELNANWIRVLHTPDSGTLDKIVLRN